jgi:putative transposase
VIKRPYQYRLYPTKKQKQKLIWIIEECRWLYNQTLAFRKDAWEEYSVSINLYNTNALLLRWKLERPSLVSIYSQVLQNVCVRVDLAFKSFFRRVKSGDKPGYPRFKGYGRYDSFTYPQSGFGIKDGKLHLAKIGNLKIKLHRPIPGKIKTLTIRHTPSGEWYACFVCECEPEPLPKNTDAVGIDVGLATFATLSTGEKIDNPRFFRIDEQELAKAQRKFSKSIKGTPEHAKHKHVVAQIHKRIVNRRRNFSHQHSRNLVNRFGTICIEDLTINRMLHNHCLAKSISDAAWSQFFRYLTYKAEWADRRLIPVDPAYTSQTCSSCGHRQKLTLDIREYRCPCCGIILDRDHNAALNILALGLQRFGIQSVEAADILAE